MRTEPLLSCAELAAVRLMLAQWDLVRRGDPMIRLMLDET